MSDQQFITPGPVHLAIAVSAGELEVVTVDGEESSVSLDGSSRQREGMHVELTGDRLVIEQRRKSLIGIRERFDGLKVQARVPHGSTVEIVTGASRATLEGTFGGLGLKSAAGAVLLRGRLDGDATVNTVSGEVRLAIVAGDLNVRTVSGDVVAEAVGGSVSAKSVSGNVRIGSLRRGRVSVQSVSGDVELGIAPGTGIDVDAGSASGKLSSEVPLSSTPSGDPGSTVVIRGNTASGDVRIFRAA